MNCNFRWFEMQHAVKEAVREREREAEKETHSKCCGKMLLAETKWLIIKFELCEAKRTRRRDDKNQKLTN